MVRRFNENKLQKKLRRFSEINSELSTVNLQRFSEINSESLEKLNYKRLRLNSEISTKIQSEINYKMLLRSIVKPSKIQ